MQMSRYKLHGVMLLTTVVAVAAWILLAGGIFLTQSSQFQMLGARKIEEQARQYAEVDAQILKYVAYDKLADENTLKGYKLHLKRAQIETVDAADWEDEITISDEKKSSDKSGGYRVATVNIYRKDDTKPRWSMDVILVKSYNSAGSNTGEDPDDSQKVKYIVYTVPNLHIYIGYRYGASCVPGGPGRANHGGSTNSFIYDMANSNCIGVVTTFLPDVDFAGLGICTAAQYTALNGVTYDAFSVDTNAFRSITINDFIPKKIKADIKSKYKDISFDTSTKNAEFTMVYDKFSIYDFAGSGRPFYYIFRKQGNRGELEVVDGAICRFDSDMNKDPAHGLIWQYNVYPPISIFK